MGELSIKVKIANRIYPLTVDAKEEESIRAATEKINQNIGELEKLYDVKDKQDLLAMVALKATTRNFDLEKKGVLSNTEIEEDLIAIDKLLEKHL